MKKQLLFILLIFTLGTSMAQRPQGVVKKSPTPPVIDGIIDWVWSQANVYNIDRPYRWDTPTLGIPGETTWRALWDDDGMYVLLVVNDDHWYPSYMAGVETWMADKPELWFDVNYVLEDGLGPAPSGANQGHYQVAPDPEEAKIGGIPTTLSNGVVYAFKVNNPDYVVEYFIPWSWLKNRDGIEFDKTGVMGFDVTIIDRDPGDIDRNRAVWANVGNIDESWSNMDDAGWITFEGAEPLVFIDKITLNSGSITKNKGAFQMVPTIIPENASNKKLRWSIVNKPGQTGFATIDDNGRIRAIANGQVTVLAESQDGAWEFAEAVVTLTNQKPTRWDLNHLRNGLLNEYNEEKKLIGWSSYNIGLGSASVADGVIIAQVNNAAQDGANYLFQIYQEPVFRATTPNMVYELSFNARAGIPRPINVSLEDPANNYNRYGASNSEFSLHGRSEWRIDLTPERERFVFDVIFDQKLPNTLEKFTFLLSEYAGTVYLDSLLLIKEADKAIIWPDDTYAFFNVNFGVIEINGATNGSLIAVVGSNLIYSGNEVQYKREVTFTALPDAGYQIKEWRKDGVVVPNHTANTFTTMVDEDMVITVQFQKPKPHGVIAKTMIAPMMDGIIDAVWANANVYNIDKPYRNTVPTLGQPGETTWRALWNEEGIYFLIQVNDDHWYPSYMTGGNPWDYDLPELYFDVNDHLMDGLGPEHRSGHYGVAHTPRENKIDGTPHTDEYGIISAFKVNGPDYLVEYFVPWTHLVNNQGGLFNRIGTMGFDVTINDRDPGDTGRRRAVWANAGETDESWTNMDDAGLITFEGSAPTVYINNITLPEGSITQDNGTLQIIPLIEPENATYKNLKWSVENKTGHAKISSNGLVRAVADGMVTVRTEAIDGSYAFAAVDIQISGQITTLWELSIIKNGTFENLHDGDNTAKYWGGWTDSSPEHVVVNNISVHTPNTIGENWRYQFSQTNLQAIPDTEYILKFKAWADAPRPFAVNFEDDNLANEWNRYGATSDPRSADGRSEWSFDITTVPTWYTFDVVFDQIQPNTIQKIMYMLGESYVTTYIDSVFLVNVADLNLITGDPMQLVFDTSLGEGTTVSLPLYGSVNATVDWGDGNQSVYFTSGDKVHTYESDGVYTVSIYGSLEQFGNNPIPYNNAEKLVRVKTFGSLGITSLGGAFMGASNLVEVPVQLPDKVTDCTSMFRGASAFNQDISGWDVSSVKSMSVMFYNASSFNQDLGGWDVSNVTEMVGMFYNAINFNQDIGNWDVRNVNMMGHMFRGAISFSQDIGNWDVSNVRLMNNMFLGANSFNQDIGRWDVSNVESMWHMFRGNESFNQDLSNWDVGNVTNMASMFRDAVAFDQDIGSWDMKNVQQLENMFEGAGLSSNNYNNLLTGWAAQSLKNDVVFHAGNSTYSSGLPATARQKIIDDFSWTIIDGGLRVETPFILTLIANPSEGGTTLGEGQYLSESLVDVTAIPALGYEFVDWTNADGEELSDQVDYSFVMPAADIEITATFKLSNFLVSLVAEPQVGGTLFGAGNYKMGDQVTVGAIPETGYVFSGWNMDDDVVSSQASYTFTMPAEDVVLKAMFSIPVYEVSLSVKPEGAGISFGAGSYKFGDQVTLGAIANSGYVFMYWVNDEGQEIANVPAYNFVMPGQNLSLTAHFDIIGFVDDSYGKKIRLYPNPASDGFYLSSGIRIESIEITDVSGRMIYKRNLEENEAYISTNGFEAGIYFIRIHKHSGVHIEKVIIKK